MKKSEIKKEETKAKKKSKFEFKLNSKFTMHPTLEEDVLDRKIHMRILGYHG